MTLVKNTGGGVVTPGDIVEATVLGVDEITPGLFAIRVEIPSPPDAGTMFVNVRIRTTLSAPPGNRTLGELENGFAYTDQALFVGDRVPQFAPHITPALAPTLVSGSVTFGDGVAFVVAQGESAPLINWSNGSVSVDVSYSVSYRPTSPVIDIACLLYTSPSPRDPE